ncbi:hypothetical protein ACKWRH_18580 [Bradyrhizobium sp. Pa8]|uniref:hypothetical protein n=1 Tax=Bradyrhizobium sp. Pa8 TaxID=3386552 RepID=UPI00403F740D
MSIVDSTGKEEHLSSSPDIPSKYFLAICCVIGPLLLGYLAPNRVADVLMPLADKSVVGFVLPNPDADSAAKIQKLKNTLAAKQKTLGEKQAALEKLDPSVAPPEKLNDAKAAVENAQTAEAAAKADVEKAEGSRDADRTIVQSKQIADTLTARYNYAATSGVLYLVSAATLLLGGTIVFRRSRMLFFVGLALSLILAGLVTKVPTAYANAGQTFLKVLLDQADQNALVFKPLFHAYKDASFKISDAIKLVIDINTFVGLLAVGVALLAFAVLSGPEDKPSLASLEERKANLQRMIALSSAILVVATFASKVVLDWPLGLIVPSQAEALRPLTSALTSHLGMTGTIALFAAAAPALVGWYQDVKRYRLDPANMSAGQRQDADKLEFGIPAAVTSIIAILGPALTSPVFTTFKGIVEMVAGGKGGA